MPTPAITKPAVADFAEDVRTGLTKRQKELFSKYLYDEIGSSLFEVISLLPEYGLTRADVRLIEGHADDIVGRLASPVVVAELGSGSGRKARCILEALSRRQRRTIYSPIEISPAALARTRLELGNLSMVSVVGREREYLDGLAGVAAERQRDSHLLVLFLGSTIGNFDREAGLAFLCSVRETMRAGDALLLSTDLVKPIPRMLAAYDDSLGVTAAFNLNLLARINRELDGGFQLDRFRHHVRYDPSERRVEMHLRSTVEQRVEIRAAELDVFLRKDETIWTENSHKYDLAEVCGIARYAGFHCQAQWVDPVWPFALSLFLVE
jgi:dimethylhistidine N-methyltransferase